MDFFYLNTLYLGKSQNFLESLGFLDVENPISFSSTAPSEGLQAWLHLPAELRREKAPFKKKNGSMAVGVGCFKSQWGGDCFFGDFLIFSALLF